MTLCNKCGALIEGESKFCAKCGAPREEQVTENVSPAENIVSEQVIEPEMPAQPAYQAEIPGQPVYQAEMPMQSVYSPIPQGPQKKSKGPIIAIISAAVVAIAAIVVAIILLLQPSVAEIDLSKYVKITYDGYDTTGTATVDIDETKLLIDILKAQGEDTNTNIISFSMKALLNSIQIEKNYYENLSNGDKISITIKYDQLLMEENDVEFSNATKDYEVKDLVELIEVDPFEDITVQFSGTSPEGYARVINESDINCVRWANTEFDKNNELKNGDTVTLRISPDSVNYAVSEGYKFTATSKDYVVEGLSYYYESMDEISDEHMAEYKEEADRVIEEAVDWMYDAEVSDIKVLGTYFAKSTVYPSNNMVIFVYTATLKSTEGAFDPTTIYIPVSMRVTCVEDGKLGNLYGGTHGYMDTEVGYDTFYGYVSGDIMYTEYILDELPDNDYEVIATEGMPEFKETTDENRLPAPSQPSTGDESSTETPSTEIPSTEIPSSDANEETTEEETTTRKGLFGN